MSSGGGIFRSILARSLLRLDLMSRNLQSVCDTFYTFRNDINLSKTLDYSPIATIVCTNDSELWSIFFSSFPWFYFHVSESPSKKRLETTGAVVSSQRQRTKERDRHIFTEAAAPKRVETGIIKSSDRAFSDIDAFSTLKVEGDFERHEGAGPFLFRGKEGAFGYNWVAEATRRNSVTKRPRLVESSKKLQDKKWKSRRRGSDRQERRCCRHSLRVSHSNHYLFRWRIKRFAATWLVLKFQLPSRTIRNLLYLYKTVTFNSLSTIPL